MTDELGFRQRDQSTSSVTKRANGYWYAVFHIWLPHCLLYTGIRGSRCTALIHPSTSEPSGGAPLLLSTSVLQRERECWRYGNSNGSHDLAASPKFVQTATPEVSGGHLPCVLQCCTRRNQVSVTLQIQTPPPTVKGPR